MPPLIRQLTTTLLFILSLYSLPSPIAVAEPVTEQVFTSAMEQTPLLELYTSQGCYSCPPAEDWINDLIAYDGLWKKVVPIALHVDYWDYLGWKDPYADKRNQRRHYAYKSQGHTNAIYTPEVVLNGQDWTTWKKGVVPNFQTGKSTGILEVTVNEQQVYVTFTSQQRIDGPLKANIAVLGFDIRDAIKRGENAGKVLAHEFVALAQNSSITEALPEQLNNSLNNTKKAINQHYAWTLPYPKGKGGDPRRLALITWIDSVNSNVPIQSTGGWLN